MKYLLVCVFVGCVAGLAIEPVGRTTLDEEELLHAMEARNEAIDMELEAAEEESKNIVEAAPEERHFVDPYGTTEYFTQYDTKRYLYPCDLQPTSRIVYDYYKPDRRVQNRYWWSDQCWYPAGARNGQGPVGFVGNYDKYGVRPHYSGGNYNNYGEKPLYGQGPVGVVGNYNKYGVRPHYSGGNYNNYGEKPLYGQGPVGVVGNYNKYGVRPHYSGGNYNNYGEKPLYSQAYTNPRIFPWFTPNRVAPVFY